MLANYYCLIWYQMQCFKIFYYFFVVVVIYSILVKLNSMLSNT